MQTTPPDATGRDPRVQRLVAWYETLTPAQVRRVPEFYAPDAVFKDPFNEVRGTPAIERILDHMFAQLEAPRFVVHRAIAEGDDALLLWDFHFRRRGGAAPFTVRGATHLAFDDAGRIALHRDYWDAAEELYAKLPLIGGLMRWLRRRLAA